ncbi:MAG TPA: PAS domain-containing sensor histidine kinase [Acidobacteriaceae bacterium]
MQEQSLPETQGAASRTKPDRIDPERWLAAIVESSDDAIIGEDLDGIITSWNAGAQRIFGYAPEEVIGKAVTCLVWPGDENQIEELLTRIRTGKRVDHFQVVRRHKDGSKVLVSLSLSPIVDADGRVIGIAKIARDITGHVAMEDSLTATTNQVRLLTEREANAQAQVLAERRFRELIENAPDGILQVDRHGKIIIANRTAELLFGYASEELVGASVDMLVPAKYRAGHAANRVGFAHGGVSRPMGQGLDLYARRKDGTEFPVEISLSPVTTAGEVHVTAVVRDVTERKRTEVQVRTLQESYMAELEARQKEAERLNHMKSEFMAGITHELRTPLHTIIGFSDLLREELEGPLNEPQRTFVGHIRQDSEHLLGLINDVLDYSRIEAGGLHLHTERLSLGEAIADAAGAIRQHAEAKGIGLRFENPAEVFVLADPMRLRQILYNLLSNAVKFTASGGDVDILVGDDAEFARITVSDTGTGIPRDELSRIFDKFYQVGYSVGGAGLGLSICKQLVEIQGGSIAVDSEPGKGSQFHFTLKKAV